ncbi:MAG TPA: sulfatase-like hydrolase/transferase, partial [Phycisphaerae bacterium]|nr:sulfatase-like hydrolase/transferase [Phycisphaerae bacterium]
KALKDLGLDAKTLVIYTSDNGPWLSKKAHGGCSLPLRDGKFSTYEGGFREPCIMRWPGTIPAAAVCAETALTMDFLPTFAKLAGADLPGGYDLNGKDISSLMTRPGAKTPHEAFFYYRGTTLEAVRSGKWKAILYAKGADGQPGKPHELYDLKADIGETTDVASANPDVVKRLDALAEAGVQMNGGKFGRGVPKKKPPKKAAAKA